MDKLTCIDLINNYAKNVFTNMYTSRRIHNEFSDYIVNVDIKIILKRISPIIIEHLKCIYRLLNRCDYIDICYDIYRLLILILKTNLRICYSNKEGSVLSPYDTHNLIFYKWNGSKCKSCNTDVLCPECQQIIIDYDRTLRFRCWPCINKISNK